LINRDVINAPVGFSEVGRIVLHKVITGTQVTTLLIKKPA